MYRISSRVLGLFLIVALFVLSGSACSFQKDDALTATLPERQMEAVDAALEYILAQQGDEGSFGGDAGITLDAVLAGAAVGEDVSSWRTAESNPTPLEYLAANWEGYAMDAAGTGKLVVGLAAADRDPHDFGGEDFVQRIASFDVEGVGRLGGSATEQAWGMLALAAAEASVTQEMVEVLIDLQEPSGGWEFAPDSEADSNTTALALQALVAAGVKVEDPSIVDGLDFLGTQQSDTGGFVYSTAYGAADADANSTAYCLQALIATGEDASSEEWLVDGNSAMDALLSFQRENGAFEWQAGEGENLLATAQAVPALLGKPLPHLP
ncbi:MAG: prenyltransferase/squalene oxidase repeat-containing protein [Anaerolineae bacterium]